VEENVYIKAGKRPPLRRRPRVVSRWLAFGLVAPTVAMVAFALLPEARPVPTGGGPAANRAAAATTGARAGGEGSPRLTPSLAEMAGSSLDASVFPVGVRRIVIDPGHGGKDVGSVTAGGLYEKDVALDIALRLRDSLRQQGGVEVLMTRDRDEHVLLRDRARFANLAKADLFVSIHLNSFGEVAGRGVETFYLGPTADPKLVQLASRENHESGYSLADVRRLLDGIYLDVRGKESRQLAGAVQRSLYTDLESKAAGPLRDRGVKSAPFLVLVATDMPAVLAEVSCLSNEEDAALLATETYRQQIADALRGGIAAYTLELFHQTPAASAPAAAARAAGPAARENATKENASKGSAT